MNASYRCVAKRETRASLKIMRLSKSGFPQAWISKETAATLYVSEKVLWTLGENAVTLTGGINASGKRSRLNLASIIACDGEVKGGVLEPALTNAVLFRRDGHLCLYCGGRFSDRELTRDHIIPRVQGGRDHWMNVVTACKRCNNRKGGRTPEQANMELLAIPFVPNAFEWMFLANRSIRGDQMEYLKARFSGQRCWVL